MTITDLAAGAYLAALDMQPELHQAWNKQSFQLAEMAGEAHLAAIQSSNRLDLLLRQLEVEHVPAPAGMIDFSLDLRFSLSECWVLRIYEVLRAAAMQLRNTGTKNEKLALLKHRLSIVRMPIAKGEIQGMMKKNSADVSLVYEDGSDAGQYANNGTYVVPRQVCADTGSAMWCPVDITTMQSVQVRRIDLSNELLTLFD